MLKRILIAATTGLFLLAGAVTYAHSEECRLQNFTQAVTEITDAGGTATEITGTARETFLEKAGQPPSIEGEFRLVRFDANGMSMIGVVQGDCLQMTAGPWPAHALDRGLGLTRAGD